MPSPPRPLHVMSRQVPVSGRFRMNRSRMPLVHDLPHGARDADAVSTAPNDNCEGTLVVASDGARTTPRRPHASALPVTPPELLLLFFVSSLHVHYARKPREALWAHDLSIRGNASSNYRTPAVHRAGPPPRTDRNSNCWCS